MNIVVIYHYPFEFFPALKSFKFKKGKLGNGIWGNIFGHYRVSVGGFPGTWVFKTIAHELKYMMGNKLWSINLGKFISFHILQLIRIAALNCFLTLALMRKSIRRFNFPSSNPCGI